MAKRTRSRFAPSPTGPLHIGGVRTALFAYLIAKQNDGDFILRIEDTDQARYVEGCEEYIKESLQWLGLTPDEGPGYGGDYGPYRQSERKGLYKKYVDQLINDGHAYIAIDTSEELDAMREREKEAGNHSAKYDHKIRLQMRNSLTMDDTFIHNWLSEGKPYTVRMKVPENEVITFSDVVRGEVSFDSSELDDKIILKGDGMPTYHMANIIDDYSMQISHVVRGEEWLSSTAHHILLYRFLNLEDQIPVFAHLPLILKPTGKGKLGKRDGKKFGFPTFPLSWKGKGEEDSFVGFKDYGFLPEAVLNFLAFLGWNPGTEQELFSIEALIKAFSLDKVSKSGARFDFDKSKWFNQQYIMASDDHMLAIKLQPFMENAGIDYVLEYLEKVVGCMKERINMLSEFPQSAAYFFKEVEVYDEKTLRKKWKKANHDKYEQLILELNDLDAFSAGPIEQHVKDFIETNELSFGQILPFLRIGLSGTMKGPSIFDIMEILGREKSIFRLKNSISIFNTISQATSNV